MYTCIYDIYLNFTLKLCYLSSNNSLISYYSHMHTYAHMYMHVLPCTHTYKLIHKPFLSEVE